METVSTVNEQVIALQSQGLDVAIVGDIGSPYDGCYYQRVVGFVKGDKVYLGAPWPTQGLNSWLRFKLIPTDVEVRSYTGESASPLCVLLSRIEEVMSGPCWERDSLEVIPAKEIESHVDYAWYGYTLCLMRDLGFTRPDGFKCRECDKPFEDDEDVKLYESEFRGNGGIGINVGKPTCAECYGQRRCSNCGEEWPDGHKWDLAEVMDVDDQGHCASCVPDRACKRCGCAVGRGDPCSDEDWSRFEGEICEECENWGVLRRFQITGCIEDFPDIQRALLDADPYSTSALSEDGKRIEADTYAPPSFVEQMGFVKGIRELDLPPPCKGTANLFEGVEEPKKPEPKPLTDGQHFASYDYDGFSIHMPRVAVEQCSHRGNCDDGVSRWTSRITRSEYCTPEALAAELSETGAWDEEELKDDAANWRRILWLTAGRIQDEEREWEDEDGSSTD